jgi:Ca2+-transporting ATPase
MIDPPRLEVKDSIALCKKAGISTVMITEIIKQPAFAIAKSLDITQDEMKNQIWSRTRCPIKEELNNKIDNLKVFARVFSEQK